MRAATRERMIRIMAGAGLVAILFFNSLGSYLISDNYIDRQRQLH